MDDGITEGDLEWPIEAMSVVVQRHAAEPEPLFAFTATTAEDGERTTTTIATTRANSRRFGATCALQGSCERKE
jgi:hypothetical protein